MGQYLLDISARKITLFLGNLYPTFSNELYPNLTFGNRKNHHKHCATCFGFNKRPVHVETGHFKLALTLPNQVEAEEIEQQKKIH